MQLAQITVLLDWAKVRGYRDGALLGWGGLEAPMVDNVLSAANLAACALYVYAAIGPVYGARTLAATADGVPGFTIQALPDDRGMVAVPEADQDVSVLQK